MRRLPRKAGLIAVSAALLAAAFGPAAAVAGSQLRRPLTPPAVAWRETESALLRSTDPDALASGTTQDTCTGWQSTYEPPTTIRVLRTRGPEKGHVQTLDFRTYVGWVISAEWPARYP